MSRPSGVARRLGSVALYQASIELEELEFACNPYHL
jgi:hypothetical protein